MARQIWQYLFNHFDNATRGNNSRMNVLSSDHVSKLKAQQSDPDIAPLLVRYQPLHEGFINHYAQWKVAKGQYKGATRSMNDMQKDLSSRIVAIWDNKIKAELGEGTADYTALMPNGRTPFQTGARDIRIAAIDALAGALEKYPSLAALKADVEDFHTQIENIRNVQQQNEQKIGHTASNLEEARVACAKMMYANLGRLMDKFYDNPVVIDRYFELQVIRKRHAKEKKAEE